MLTNIAFRVRLSYAAIRIALTPAVSGMLTCLQSRDGAIVRTFAPSTVCAGSFAGYYLNHSESGIPADKLAAF